MKVVIKNVRIAFPNIWEPKSYNGQGKPRCNALFIIEKDNAEALKAVKEAILAVAKEEWKEKAETMLSTLKAKGDLCLHDGAEKADYDGFEGNMFVSASNASRPIVVDRDRSPLTEADGKPYAGCYVNVSIDVWAQDNQYGKRVNAKLLAIQFARDGDAFGGGSKGSADDFDTIEGEETAADLF